MMSHTVESLDIRSLSLDIQPVYKYSAREPWRFLYSINPDIKDGWKRELIAFYGFTVNGTNRDRNIIPVYQFVATSPYYRYQYSTSPTVNGPGWKNEGIAFYTVHKLPQRQAGLRFVQQFKPVYQYHSIENGNWRYQYSMDENLGGGWTKGKDIAFYALENSVTSLALI